MIKSQYANIDSLMLHRGTKSQLPAYLRSGSYFSPSINWTQPGTHPHLATGSAPYHFDQTPSQGIRSLTSISHPSHCTYFDSTKHVYKVQFKKPHDMEQESIIEHTYHHTIIERTIHHAIIERTSHFTINCTLHRAYYKPTPHHHSKCSQHRTSMSICHRISKPNLEASHNIRITTLASPLSPHLS